MRVLETPKHDNDKLSARQMFCNHIYLSFVISGDWMLEKAELRFIVVAANAATLWYRNEQLLQKICKVSESVC